MSLNPFPRRAEAGNGAGRGPAPPARVCLAEELRVLGRASVSKEVISLENPVLLAVVSTLEVNGSPHAKPGRKGNTHEQQQDTPFMSWSRAGVGLYGDGPESPCPINIHPLAAIDAISVDGSVVAMGLKSPGVRQRALR